jgi:hypothetical protein
MTGYEPRHAEGFIRIFGQPIATALNVQESKPSGVKGETSDG